MTQKTDKKGILINLDEGSRIYLRSLAEKNSSSMSQEVRRLIKDEEEREQLQQKRHEQ
jgi:hypothetical protein